MEPMALQNWEEGRRGRESCHVTTWEGRVCGWESQAETAEGQRLWNLMSEEQHRGHKGEVLGPYKMCSVGRER